MHRLTIKLVAVFLTALTGYATASPLQIQGVSAIGPGQTPSAGGNGDSCIPILSADGRYVLFASTANNLVLTTNGVPIASRVPARFNVFLRDRLSQVTTLVSVNTNGGAGGNGDSLPVVLSTNGQFALFESGASDLISGDTNNAVDVYLRDLVAGTTTLVSVATNSASGNGGSRGSVMTPDARYVAFVSEAANLVAGDSNRIADVFVRNLQTLTTTRASAGARSTNAAAMVSAGKSDAPDISDDGRFIAYSSTATNLVTGIRTIGDLYVYDQVAGTNIWASSGMRAAVLAAKGHTNGVVCDFALSADGSFVAYQVNVPQNQFATNSGVLLRYGVQNGTTELLHANIPTSRPSPEETKVLDLTADGQVVAFVANSNGVNGATTCIQVWDATSGINALASGDLSNLVASNAISLCPMLDATGRYVAFRSSATGLVSVAVAGDWHVYVRDLLNATTMLVDVSPNGASGLVTAATIPSMSSEARFVAFESADAALLPNDNNHHFDIFVRDLALGTNDLISAHDPALGSLTPNRPSLDSSFSASTDGRYVAFASDADNLIGNDTNGFRDVFVRDVATNVAMLVSVGLGGLAANGFSSEPAISGDGRYVAFSSTATNLVIGDTNRSSDVFVRDLQTGTTVLATVKPNSSWPGNKASYAPMLSADGRWLLFRCEATDLATGSFTGTNLFVRDLSNATNYALTTAGAGAASMTPSGRFVAFVAGSFTTRFHLWDSAAAGLVYTNTTSGVSKPAVSADGNLLAYIAASELRIVDRVVATNWLVASGIFTTGVVSRVTLQFSADGKWLTYARRLAPGWQTFLYDVQNRVETLVSHEINSSTDGGGDSEFPDISPDGRFVTYGTTATNVVPGVNGLVRQIVLYDRQTGLNRLVSAKPATAAPADDYSLRASFSGDGQTLLFQSWASDLVGGDFNRSGDVFVYPILTAVILPPLSGQGPWLYWPFLPGNNYSVEFKNNLEDPIWQTLPGSYTTNGVKAWLQDASPTSGQRVYRINSF